MITRWEPSHRTSMIIRCDNRYKNYRRQHEIGSNGVYNDSDLTKERTTECFCYWVIFSFGRGEKNQILLDSRPGDRRDCSCKKSNSPELLLWLSSQFRRKAPTVVGTTPEQFWTVMHTVVMPSHDWNGKVIRAVTWLCLTSQYSRSWLTLTFKCWTAAWGWFKFAQVV